MTREKRLTRACLGLVLAVVAVGLAACGGGKSGGAAGGGGMPKLTDIQGTVTVNAQATKETRELAANDKVQVAQGSVARVVYPDGTKILLVGRTAEGSELTIGAITQDQGLAVMLVKLGKGMLSFVVPPTVKGKGRYEIEAVSSLTVVRGTQGSVKTGEADSVALKHGTVEVLAKTGGKSATIVQGQQVAITAAGEISAPSTYDFSDEKERELYSEGPLLMKTLTH